MKKLASAKFFWLGFFIAVIPDVLVLYLIMPFPGSQQLDSVDFAWQINRWLWVTRIAGFLLMIPYAVNVLSDQSKIRGIFYPVLFIAAGVIIWFTGFHYRADQIFREPSQKIFLDASQNKYPLDKIVIGVTINGESRAYPLNVIGYHHKFLDTVGGKTVLVTYCTMCRIGQVYDPVVNGELLHWTLVGMGHWNATIGDTKTNSWWYQATGTACAGPMKGTVLAVIPSEQMTLKSWLAEHPNSLILQPDPKFQDRYNKLNNYDTNFQTAANNLKDSSKPSSFSWVIAIQVGDKKKYFTWQELQKRRVINDTLGNTPLMLALENDHQSFHAFNRTIQNRTLNFSLDSLQRLSDIQTHSIWGWDGKCISGSLQGEQLQKIEAHQIYWHTWENFYARSNMVVFTHRPIH